ncbi:MAG: hypothetical protein EA001_08345 [Oscillatoriales cyanobacterium]|nr:MAG: hypothetical protein EA001_08345 [Oscillatoriales cyanobacterium]
MVLAGTPALAHTVKVSGDVAALFHLEPNHNPKSGEPARVWFGLTRQGGATLPLDRCNCTLAIAPLPGGGPAIAPWSVALEPISAEGYQNIPGATVVFPRAGGYELTLRGQPKQAGDFKPFELRYKTTVLAGAAAPLAAQPAPSPQSSSPTTPATAPPEPLWDQRPLIGLGAIGLGLIGWFGWAIRRSGRQS